MNDLHVAQIQEHPGYILTGFFENGYGIALVPKTDHLTYDAFLLRKEYSDWFNARNEQVTAGFSAQAPLPEGWAQRELLNLNEEQAEELAERVKHLSPIT
jgi:hypothetical protein